MARDTKIELRMPSYLKEELRQEADRQHTSMAWIMLRALREYLNK